VNPFGEAYAILSKTLDAPRLAEVGAVLAARRTTISPEDAKGLAVLAQKYKRQNDRLPSIMSADAYEKLLAEGALAFMRHRKEGRYD
jgi:hypothetical protein